MIPLLPETSARRGEYLRKKGREEEEEETDDEGLNEEEEEEDDDEEEEEGDLTAESEETEGMLALLG